MKEILHTSETEDVFLKTPYVNLENWIINNQVGEDSSWYITTELWYFHAINLVDHMGQDVIVGIGAKKENESVKVTFYIPRPVDFHVQKHIQDDVKGLSDARKINLDLQIINGDKENFEKEALDLSLKREEDFLGSGTLNLEDGVRLILLSWFDEPFRSSRKAAINWLNDKTQFNGKNAIDLVKEGKLYKVISRLQSVDN